MPEHNFLIVGRPNKETENDINTFHHFLVNFLVYLSVALAVFVLVIA